LIDKAALGRQVAEARKLLISQGGQATLRFGVSMEHGYQATNHRKVAEAMCALWNAAPELLKLGFDPVIQPSTRMLEEEREPPAETHGDMC
jgi:hypothetical protein